MRRIKYPAILVLSEGILVGLLLPLVGVFSAVGIALMVGAIVYSSALIYVVVSASERREGKSYTLKPDRLTLSDRGDFVATYTLNGITRTSEIRKVTYVNEPTTIVVSRVQNTLLQRLVFWVDFSDSIELRVSRILARSCKHKER